MYSRQTVVARGEAILFWQGILPLRGLDPRGIPVAPWWGIGAHRLLTVKLMVHNTGLLDLNHELEDITSWDPLAGWHVPHTQVAVGNSTKAHASALPYLPAQQSILSAANGTAGSSMRSVLFAELVGSATTRKLAGAVGRAPDTLKKVRIAYIAAVIDCFLCRWIPNSRWQYS